MPPCMVLPPFPPLISAMNAVAILLALKCLSSLYLGMNPLSYLAKAAISEVLFSSFTRVSVYSRSFSSFISTEASLKQYYYFHQHIDYQ